MEKRSMTEERIARFEKALIEDEKSPVTIQKYRRDVKAFAAFAGNREVTKELVIHYKQWLIDRYAPASVNSMLAAVNRFFKDMG